MYQGNIKNGVLILRKQQTIHIYANAKRGLPGATGPQGPPGQDGQGLPTGGTDGQVPVKQSSTDFDIAWETPPVAPVASVNGQTGVVVLDASDVGALSKDDYPLNVKDFGALGDGTTNDSTAIQQTVDAAFAAGGGTVYLPKGVYRLASSIIWKSGVSLVGDGIGKSILRQMGTQVDAIYNDEGGSPYGDDPSAVPLVDCEFRDFEIDGSAMTSTAPSVSGKGIFILYMKRCKFINLYIHHTIGTGLGADFLDEVVMDGVIANNNGRNWTGSGVTVGQSGIGIGTNWKSVEAVTISNCHANNNGNYGMFVETQSPIVDQTIWPKGARFVACYAEGNRHGFGNKGSGGTTFSACEANNNIKYGFYSSTQNRDDIYVGCKASGNEYGFYVENSLGYITMNGCNSFDNSQHGVTILQSTFGTWKCENILITGCMIKENGWSGIRITGTSAEIRNITITGNHIIDNGQALVGFQRQGISMNGTVSNILVSSNLVGNTPGTSTQVYGVDTINGTVDNLTVTSNMFRGNSAAGVYNTGATVTNRSVVDNTGYKNFATGVGTIANGNSTVTIPHGLVATPTKVMVSPTSDVNIWPSTLGASGVIYSRTGTSGSVSFTWSAEV